VSLEKGRWEVRRWKMRVRGWEWRLEDEVKDRKVEGVGF